MLKLFSCLVRRVLTTALGTHALPGGHLEQGESFEGCASREVHEETGLSVHDIRFLTATNSVFKENGKHYVTIFMTAIADPAINGCEPEAELTEPDKCEGWMWQSFEEMHAMENTAKLFQPLLDLAQQRPDVCLGFIRRETKKFSSTHNASVDSTATDLARAAHSAYCTEDQ